MKRRPPPKKKTPTTIETEEKEKKGCECLQEATVCMYAIWNFSSYLRDFWGLNIHIWPG